MLKDARQQFVDIRSDFLRRASESENQEIVTINENGRFDVLIERVLSEIANSDGPINAREANVLNVLLGKEASEDYYNSSLRRPETRTFDAAEPFSAFISIAIQLGGIEQGTAYNPKTDPIVGCFETLGHAILAADGEIDQLELDRLSKYTAIAHSKAAKLYQRINSLVDGRTDNIGPPAEVEKLAKTADKITPTG